MADVRDWLDSIGCGQYAEAFEKNELDWDVIPELDHDVLREIGVTAAGARMRILKVASILDLESGAPSYGDPVPPAASEAERRQLTVMFCDLVGSTELSESMDPEAYRELLVAYQSAARSAIERYEGYIARYMGDGLLVYFGYPQAHEEDPERAVLSGSAIVDAVQSLQVRGEVELKVRIGIATGLVVAGDIVGEGASEERAVLGDAPNLAARLQALAAPNAIVVSRSTLELARGRFEFEPLGLQSLKGIREPVPAYRPVEISGSTRFEVLAARGLTPLTGRESELTLLYQRWGQAIAGEGQVVLLEGEPGIGKSRVVQALADRIDGGEITVLSYQCSPWRSTSPTATTLKRFAMADTIAAFAHSRTPASAVST